jgi:hypothetical protein
VLAVSPVVEANLKQQHIGLRSCSKPRGRDGAVEIKRRASDLIEGGGIDVDATSQEKPPKGRRRLSWHHGSLLDEPCGASATDEGHSF